MDKNKKKNVSDTSSTSSFDHIFGPRISSSSTTGLFKSIFPPPSPEMLGRQVDFASQGGHVKYKSPRERSKKKERNSYNNEEKEPPCHLSSSLYYGGQEKYPSTITKDNYKKDGEEGDSHRASRGNWWEGNACFPI
ncbi:unnamed protein product [Cochlearia groenlandica]